MPKGSNSTPLPDAASLRSQVESVVRQLPDRLRAFRESLDLTQRQLADLIRVDETTVYRLEKGETQPNFYTYTALLLIGFQPPEAEGQGRPASVFEAAFSTSATDEGESGLWSRSGK